MTNQPEKHPSKDQLVAFGLGKLDESDAELIAEHLDKCQDCSATIVSLTDDTFVSLVRNSPAPAAESEAPPQAEDSQVAHDATIDVASGVTDGTSRVVELPPELRAHPRYEILKLIGHGGMGDVYKAQHKVMNRTVALKVIKPELVRNDAAVERFRREVQAAAQLHHKNIVTAYDAEQAGNLHYLVMEFVDGVDLDEVIRKRGPLPVKEACAYIQQAAEGLQHAHELGMVHRDIKPHNLMVTVAGSLREPDSRSRSERSTVKILDFGLANFAAEEAVEEAIEAESPSGVGAPQLTLAGSMMGTPDYMAPEQADDAHSADIRADIYSLGCTLYCLLTGKAPFTEGSVMDKVKAHTEEAVTPLSEFRDDVPEEIEAVLLKTMAKDPAERYQTPAEVAEALAHCSPDAPRLDMRVSESPAYRKRRPLVLTAVATLFLALLAAAATIFYIQTDNGVVRVEVTDPSLKVTIAGQTITTDDNGKPLTIGAGEQQLIVRHKDSDFELLTESFQLSRGDRVALKVELLPGKVVVRKDGERFGAKAVPGLESAPPRNEVVFSISENEDGPGTISRFQGEIVKDPKVFLERLKLMTAENPDLVIRIEGRLDLERDDFLEGFENAIRAAGVRYLKLPPEIEEQRRDAAARKLAEEQKRATRKHKLKLIGIALREYLGRAGEFPPSASVVPVPPAPRETSRARGPSRSPGTQKTGTKQPETAAQTPVSPTTVARPGRSTNAFFDEDGQPHLSWRVHLLPFFRQKKLTELYKQFHLDEPWDSPHNKPLLDQMPDVYKTTDDPTVTTLLAVTGKGTAYEGQAGLKESDMTDGLTNLIYVVDAGAEKAVPWTKPEDLPFDRDDPIRAFGTSDFGDIFLAVMADIDSAVHEIPRDIAPASLRAMLTRAGNDVYDPNAKRTNPVPTASQPPSEKAMIEQAASIPLDEWKKLSTSENPLSSVITGSPLSLVLTLLNPAEAAKTNPKVLEDFRYLKPGVPKATEIAQAMSHSSEQGYASMLQRAYILKVNTNSRQSVDETGKSVIQGTIDFEAPQLYAGRVHFTAEVEGQTARVTEFRLPNYNITIRRDEEGVWQRSQTEN